MRSLFLMGIGVALAAIGSSPATAADPSGKYQRPNGDRVIVWVAEGRLYCRIEQGKRPGFEMCHGMAPQGANWFGKRMKHPSMPSFMTFNGTVSSDPQKITIKGCAMGKAMCQSELWKKIG